MEHAEAVREASAAHKLVNASPKKKKEASNFKKRTAAPRKPGAKTTTQKQSGRSQHQSAKRDLSTPSTEGTGSDSEEPGALLGLNKVMAFCGQPTVVAAV